IGNRDYEMEVGSLNEPVHVDDKTGVELTVSDEHTKAPITGLEKTLKVEIAAGDQKKVFNFEPAWEAAGSYTAVYFPTVQTTYSYRIFGTINATPFDATFTCSIAPEN